MRVGGICDGRSAIVTGAGGGLGRAYARALAEEGCAVLVNDIRADAAAAVVAEITAAGGKAVANSDDITSMAGAARIIDQAVQAFGDVHAVVNNAGIVRDRFFVNMTEDEWDAVMRVHLRGHFCLSNLLARRWRDAQKAGKPVAARIINTSSGAGLQGSVGQANYAAAKAGIAALTLVQAVELGRYGITVNCLVPAARTPMTEPVFGAVMKPPEDGSFDKFAPENVAPLVVWLVSENSSDVTGQAFEVEGGKIGIAEGWHSGAVRDKGARWSPVEVGEVVRPLLRRARAPQPVFGS